MEDNDILKRFDSIFKTDTLHNVNFQNMKLVSAIYNAFEDKFNSFDENYKNLTLEQVSVVNELAHTFNENQAKLFEKYLNITSDMLFNDNKQLFLFGYIVAKQLDLEGHI